MKSRRRVFRQRRRRRRWIWALPLLAAVATATLALRPLRPPLPATGIGQELVYQSIGKLPAWAQQAVKLQAIAPEYQLVAAIVDLNRDEQFEILVAPAPPRPDLFIPDINLRVVRFEADHWRASAAPVSCRPPRLGGFLTGGYWDLPCRNGRGRHVLRWDGSQYAAS